MESMRQRVGATVVICAWLAVAGDASAQDDYAAAEPANDPVAEARALAQTALDHLDAKRWAEALEVAERAEKLYHAPIHMRIIGQALEGLGRLAEAAAVYDRLAAEPLPSTAHQVFRESQEFARGRIKELAARLPSLLVKVEGSEEATITIDGRPVEASGVAVRVDPGDHVVRAEADGMVPYEKRVTAEEGSGVVVVTAVLRAPGEPPAPEPDVVIFDAEESGGPPVATWVLFGLGGAALAAGAITGGLSLAAASDLEERCPDRHCTPADEPDYDRAVALGWASTALLAAGGVGAAVGVVVWIADASGEPEAGSDATARFDVGPGGFRLTHRF
jgi:hypothetical protein